MATLTDTLALRVPHHLKEELEQLSKSTMRKKSDILLGWISEKLEQERWQIQETLLAIRDADSGLFATESEVKRIKKKWQIKS